MRTTLEVSLKTQLTRALGDLEMKVSVVMGRFVSKWLRTYEGYAELKKHVMDGPIPQSKIDEIVASIRALPRSYVDAQIPFTDADIADPKNSTAHGARFVSKIIEENRGRIRSVVSIGGQHDCTSSYLAAKYPDISFTSVDFTPLEVLTDFNRLYPQSKNWRLVSGNALEMLRDGRLKADLVFMSSVGFLMNSAEVDSYADALKGVAGMVAITEAWFSFVLRSNPLKIWRPEDIHPTESAVTPFFGVYNLYQHNYPAKFQRAGFSIASSALYESGNPRYLKLDFLAVNPAFR